jgi:hypothetical protein
MTWEQLIKSQAKDYKIYLIGYKDSLDQLNADKALLLGQHTEATAPQNVRDKINRDFNAWQEIWGMDGQKIRAMRAIHQKELDAFFSISE